LLIQWRGTRLVKCPETGEHVAVHVDNKAAAASGMFGAPEIRLDACTRWPERQNCGQECLHELKAAPEDCMLHHVAVNWYQGKRCVYCGRDVSGFRWPDFRCALRLSEGVTAEWQQITPEKLPGVLEKAQPVCWQCHVAETLRREHPDLVTDR